jgi:hypothetical protein
MSSGTDYAGSDMMVRVAACFLSVVIEFCPHYPWVMHAVVARGFNGGLSLDRHYR